MDPTLFDSIGDWNLFNPYEQMYQPTRVPYYPGFSGDQVNTGRPSVLDQIGAQDPNAPDNIDAGGGQNFGVKGAMDHAHDFMRLAGMASENPAFSARTPGAAASVNRHAPPAYGGGHGGGKLAPFGFGLAGYRKAHFGGSFL